MARPRACPNAIPAALAVVRRRRSASYARGRGPQLREERRSRVTARPRREPVPPGFFEVDRRRRFPRTEVVADASCGAWNDRLEEPRRSPGRFESREQHGGEPLMLASLSQSPRCPAHRSIGSRRRAIEAVPLSPR